MFAHTVPLGTVENLNKASWLPKYLCGFLLLCVVIAAIIDNNERAEEHRKANLFVGSLKNGIQIMRRGKYIVWVAASELVMDYTSFQIY